MFISYVLYKIHFLRGVKCSFLTYVVQKRLEKSNRQQIFEIFYFDKHVFK